MDVSMTDGLSRRGAIIDADVEAVWMQSFLKYRTDFGLPAPRSAACSSGTDRNMLGT